MSRADTFYRVVGVMILIAALAPVGWLLFGSLRAASDVLNRPYALTGALTTQNLAAAVRLPSFWRSLVNSCIAATMSCVFTLAICIPVAYASSRFEFVGRRFIQALGLGGYVLAPVILAVPYLRFLTAVHLTNSILGITLLHVALSIPFCLSLLAILFQGIPSAPEEVAILAGMDGLTLLRRIVLPSARLPILAVGLLTFLVSWKEYFFSLIVSNGDNSQTLPLLLSAMMAGEAPQWNLLFALSVAMMLPGILLLLAAARLRPFQTRGGARG